MMFNKFIGLLNSSRFVKRKAFTLLEVVIALAIVGIVTVLVLPQLQVDVHKIALNVHKKVFHTRVAQAIPMMETLKDINNAKEFAEKYRTVLKLHMICEGDKFFACGLPQVFTGADGAYYGMPRSWLDLNTKLVEVDYEDEETGEKYSYSQEDFDSISFITDNQEAVNLFFNPACKRDLEEDDKFYFVASKACVNMIFDLNGTKPPNTVGVDIGFLTVFNPTDSIVVAPTSHIENVATSQPQVASGEACRAISGKLRVPTDYELASMFINAQYIGGGIDSGAYWSSTILSSDYAWYLWGDTGLMMHESFKRDAILDVRCVRR